jgi:hypothetical protein
MGEWHATEILLSARPVKELFMFNEDWLHEQLLELEESVTSLLL